MNFRQLRCFGRDRRGRSKEGLRLLDTGKVVMRMEEEEGAARQEALATDLANANEVMADQDSLLNALRMRTY